jgi:hypothetical protein
LLDAKIALQTDQTAIKERNRAKNRRLEAELVAYTSSKYPYACQSTDASKLRICSPLTTRLSG